MRQIRKYGKKATAPEPCTRLATQDPRSGTPHHTNSESIAHAPKATGSGEIEATIARQHKSIECVTLYCTHYSGTHATIPQLKFTISGTLPPIPFTFRRCVGEIRRASRRHDTAPNFECGLQGGELICA